MAPSTSWPGLLESLLEGVSLGETEATALMRGWIDGQIEPELTGALLAALRAKGVSGTELAAMARVLRAAVVLPCPRPTLPLVDTCGTGGDGAGSFNISTAVAFVAAACGASVAKHGNRSASGKVGSADVLEALGLNLQAPAAAVVGALPGSGVTFLFAPGWHPALVGLAPLRRRLGVRTVFNLLGPLVNPLCPEAQVVGVARPGLLEPMAEALNRLGLERAVVVHGHGGLDEASLSGPSELRLVEKGEIRHLQLDPLAMGLAAAPSEALGGGDLETNRRILEAVLRGGGSSAQRDVVALNTALVLWAAGRAATLQEGLDQAQRSLASEAPWQRLLALRQALAPVADQAAAP
ncbi:anthranilate phosphoribosyltransferase [Synechococcus sp. CS-1325]|uniref:anthranilate phosphoribosyltransferase n=1 Tax=unclassified Synechococcus TaxID=2626047 RepID=UPI000DB464E1|nr:MULTISPECIES: anthranilate phosphoribosyltransferase [unclassified Synechococcus]MCT0198280.1 anthranilate phosphoribosyltransferase [Synechococcus sp. CS-1325]MCT0230864.1 anthranilate phosphoribosyltransferase [Synechococcus sp. CS-1324]PZV00709.1 MAG: anthranilate phosphoribosyltransferase [Cyanobium sp.]PZV01143.1 MAG: anthranilate phosphoribosyltransferase [Cyanobium sp.]